MTMQEWYLSLSQMRWNTIMKGWHSLKSNSSIDDDIDDDDDVMDDENDDDDETSSNFMLSPAKQGSCWGPTDRTAWSALATWIFPTVTHWFHGAGWYSSTCQAKDQWLLEMQWSPQIWRRKRCRQQPSIFLLQQLRLEQSSIFWEGRREESRLLLQGGGWPQKRGSWTHHNPRQRQTPENVSNVDQDQVSPH